MCFELSCLLLALYNLLQCDAFCLESTTLVCALVLVITLMVVEYIGQSHVSFLSYKIVRLSPSIVCGTIDISMFFFHYGRSIKVSQIRLLLNQ